MGYDEIAALCEKLTYRNKFRLAQLLIQLARKEEEARSPDSRNPTVNSLQLIDYVTERLQKSRPANRSALLNFIGAMFQFRGGISDEDKEAIVAELKRNGKITIADNGRVSYQS